MTVPTTTTSTQPQSTVTSASQPLLNLIKNFYILHKPTGKIYYGRNYAGEPLDDNALMLMSTSIVSYAKSVLKDELCEFVTQQSHLIYRAKGQFLFVAQVPTLVGSSLLQAMMTQMMTLIEFLYGAPEGWDDENMDIRGAADIIHNYIIRCLSDPSLVLLGHRKAFIDPDCGERLNSLLAFIESFDGVYGNSSMLLVGDAVLYSRLDQRETRAMQQYLWMRPLGTEPSRYTPVFVGGSWKNLCLVRVNAYVLAMLTFLDRTYDLFQERIDEFKISLSYSRMELPMEEPLMTLRLFAKRETLCMLYHNTKTGITVMPQLRPGPELQQREILTIFWWLFCQACQTMNTPGVTEFSSSKDGYRFYTRTEGVHRMYILLDNSVASASSVFTDVLKNVIQRSETTLL